MEMREKGTLQTQLKTNYRDTHFLKEKFFPKSQWYTKESTYKKRIVATKFLVDSVTRKHETPRKAWLFAKRLLSTRDTGFAINITTLVQLFLSKMRRTRNEFEGIAHNGSSLSGIISRLRIIIRVDPGREKENDP